MNNDTLNLLSKNAKLSTKCHQLSNGLWIANTIVNLPGQQSYTFTAAPTRTKREARLWSQILATHDIYLARMKSESTNAMNTIHIPDWTKI